MEQAEHYQSEADALFQLLDTLSTADFTTPTSFKQWSIEDIIGHLFMFDTAARLSLQSDQEFSTFFTPIQSALASGSTLYETQIPWLNGLHGRQLLDDWYQHSAVLSAAYVVADPKRRLKWAGPDMSARSSITARHMETWSHGHSAFDALGTQRTETDRVRSVCHLGVATFGWTFANRQLTVPEAAPRITLTAPSQALWSWNDESPAGSITGSAVEFAQVVTQVRNIADTSLEAQGDIAAQWMRLAQCFAGPPVDPPAPGERTA